MVKVILSCYFEDGEDWQTHSLGDISGFGRGAR